MSDVAAYHVLFPVQEGMWTGYSVNNVNNFRLIYDIKLVHLLVCSIQ